MTGSLRKPAFPHGPPRQVEADRQKPPLGGGESISSAAPWQARFVNFFTCSWDVCQEMAVQDKTSPNFVYLKHPHTETPTQTHTHTDTPNDALAWCIRSVDIFRAPSMFSQQFDNKSFCQAVSEVPCHWKCCTFLPALLSLGHLLNYCLYLRQWNKISSQVSTLSLRKFTLLTSHYGIT